MPLTIRGYQLFNVFQIEQFDNCSIWDSFKLPRTLESISLEVPCKMMRLLPYRLQLRVRTAGVR